MIINDYFLNGSLPPPFVLVVQALVSKVAFVRFPAVWFSKPPSTAGYDPIIVCACPTNVMINAIIKCNLVFIVNILNKQI